MQRFSYEYTIPSLTRSDARNIVERRLASARSPGSAGLMPFAEDALDDLDPTSWSSPRRLIKVMWYAISLAAQRQVEAPLSSELVKKAEGHLYSAGSEG